jgi:hypothetical protein
MEKFDWVIPWIEKGRREGWASFHEQDDASTIRVAIYASLIFTAKTLLLFSLLW